MNEANGNKRLIRTRKGRLLAGVCSGIGEYAGIDPTVVRVIFLALTLVTAASSRWCTSRRGFSFGETTPYELPQRYKDKKGSFDLSAPLDFVYTADTIGGNSGSPVINRNAEFVGINFDSNIQNFLRPGTGTSKKKKAAAPSASTAPASSEEPLRKVYETNRILKEWAAQIDGV